VLFVVDKVVISSQWLVNSSHSKKRRLLTTHYSLLTHGGRHIGFARLAISSLAVFTLLSGYIYLYTPAFAPVANAAANNTINFQARLLTNTGALVPDGYYNVEFKLYDAVSGGTLLWTDSRYDTNGVTAGNDYRIQVMNGYLTVSLGDTSAGGTAFPGTIDWSQELWLSMNIGGTTQTASPTWNGEMSPRMKVTAVPYAFAAKEAQQLKVTDSGFTSTVSVTTPTANRTITFADQSGTVVLDSTLTTEGDIYYRNGSGLARLARGANGECLTSNTTTILWGTCGSGGSTLQGAYDAGSAGDQVIALDDIQDSLIFRNPVSNGSNGTGYLLTLDQLATGAMGGLDIQSAGTGNLLRIRDTTATATDVLTVADGGAVTFRNQTDSTAALRVQTAGGTTGLNYDTTNQLLTLRSANSTSVLGAELFNQAPPNNNFNNATYWTLGAGWGSASATSVTATNATSTLIATSSNFSVTSGKYYQLSFTIGSYTSGTITPIIGNVNGPTFSANGTYTTVIKSSNTNTMRFNGTSFSGVISNVSVKEITPINNVLNVQDSSGVPMLEVKVSNSNTNTAYGFEAGSLLNTGTSNTAIGSYALQSTTTGLENTAIGMRSLRNNVTGQSNTAIGINTLYSNTSGNSNTAIGSYALSDNITGYENVAVGASALNNNTSGYYNIAIGSQSLDANTSGRYNVGLGHRSVFSNVVGEYNTAIGDSALYNGTGSNNTAIGSLALFSVTSGSDNVGLGYQAGGSDGQFISKATAQRSAAIGAYSQVYSNDTIALGGQGQYASKIGIGTGLPTNRLSAESFRTRSGTVTTNGTTTVTGTGTSFNSTMVGDIIYIATNSSSTMPYIRTITGYTSPTSITVDSSVPALTNASYYINYTGLQLTNTGYVGINTLSPTRQFDVRGDALFRNASDSTTAFSIQNANSVNILNIDTTNGELEVGSYNGGTNPVNGKLVINNSTNANTVTLVSGATSSSYTLTLPTALGASGDCLVDTTGAGVLGFVSCGGSGTTLQGAYTAGSAGDQVISLSSANDSIIIRNPVSSGTDSSYALTIDQLATGAVGGIDIQSTGTGNLLRLTDTSDSSLDVFTVADEGAVTIRTQTDSVAAFQLQDSNADVMLNYDNINRVLTTASFETQASYGSDVFGADNNSCSGTDWTDIGVNTWQVVNYFETLDCTSPLFTEDEYYLVTYTTDVPIGERLDISLGGGPDESIIEPATNGTIVLRAGSSGIVGLSVGSYTAGADITISSIKPVTFASKALEVINPSTMESSLDLRVQTKSIGFGQGSLQFAKDENFTEDPNTAFGYQTLYNNLQGTGNSAFGANSLFTNRDGVGNSAFGQDSLTYNTSGDYNIAFGLSALNANRTGSNNTAVGTYALNMQRYGSNNTALGYYAGGNSISDSDFRALETIQGSTAIGWGSTVYQDNTIALGGQSNEAIKVGIGTGKPTGVLSVEPLQYNTGTVNATNASSTVTGNGTTFTSAMVGSKIYIGSNDELVAPYSGTITAVNSATNITVSPSLGFTESSADYYINYTGLQVATNGNVGIGLDAPTATLQVAGTGIFKNNTNSTTAFQIQNSAGTSLLTADTTNNILKVTSDITATSAATGTTGTTEAVARTNVTTVTLTAAGSFANNDVIFIDNAGQDYYTRIVSGGGTTTLTVSPEVSYDASATVTKYTVQNIGATASDYTTQSNRFFQGYFLGGVVTGAGSTTLSDGSLSSTSNLRLQATNVNVDGVLTARSASQALRVQNAAGNINYFAVDTTNNLVQIGSAAATTNLRFYNASNGNTITLAQSTSGSGTITIPGLTGTMCLAVTGGGNCDDVNTGYLLNTTTIQDGNLYIRSSDSTEVTARVRGATGQSADILQVQNAGGGTNLLRVGSNGSFALANTTATTFSVSGSDGSATFKNSTNSTTAFQIQPSGSTTPVLNVDTTNARVGIGTNAPLWDLSFGATADRLIGIDTRTTSGAGYSLTVTSGGGFGTGAGGDLILAANGGGATNGAGGITYVAGGSAQGTGNGGGLWLQGGQGGNGATGNGGPLNIRGGTAISTNGNGGDIQIIAGTKTGTGTGGKVTIRPGSSGDRTDFFAIQNASLTDVLSVDTVNGRVGIGVSNPGSRFVVRSATAGSCSIQLLSTSAGNNLGCMYEPGGGGGGFLLRNAADTAYNVGLFSDTGSYIGLASSGNLTSSTSLAVNSGTTATDWLAVMSNASTADQGGLLLHQDTTYGFQFAVSNTSATTGSLRVTYRTASSGAINTAGIKTFNLGGASEAGGMNLVVNGSNTVCTIGNGTGGTSCSSDSRLKDITGVASGNLNKLLQLQPTYFTWKKNSSAGQQLGLIAQDVQSQFPEFITVDESGYLQLNYAGLVTPLIGAVQEQQDLIEQNQTDIAVLQSTANILNGGTITGNLNVSGATTLDTLTVNSDAIFNGNLTVQNITVANITVNGKIITAGNTPTATVGIAAGTEDTLNNIAAPTVTITGNDTSGTITIVAGANTTADELAELTFNVPFTNKPRIVFSPANRDSAKVGAYYDATSTTANSFSIYTDEAPQAGKTYEFTYFIVQ
jgi:hypothetical protein